MTETSTAAPETRQAYPESIGFGFAELIVLLNMVRGDAARASAEALRVDNELEDTPLLSAGASSLVARGLATVETDGELSVGGPVAAVTAALTSANRRMEIALLTAESADSVLSIESDEYKILLQPRAYQSWFAMAQNPEISPADGNFHVMRKHLEDNPDGGATIKRREDLAGRILLLKRSNDAWTVGYKDAGSNSIEEIPGLSDDEVLARIQDIRQD